LLETPNFRLDPIDLRSSMGEKEEIWVPILFLLFPALSISWQQETLREVNHGVAREQVRYADAPSEKDSEIGTRVERP
jgi:hypothetical protein